MGQPGLPYPHSGIPVTMDKGGGRICIRAYYPARQTEMIDKEIISNYGYGYGDGDSDGCGYGDGYGDGYGYGYGL